MYYLCNRLVKKILQVFDINNNALSKINIPAIKLTSVLPIEA